MDGEGLRPDNEKRNAAAHLYCVHFRTFLADSMSSRFSIQ
jgi:hypothetical protein